MFEQFRKVSCVITDYIFSIYTYLWQHLPHIYYIYIIYMGGVAMAIILLHMKPREHGSNTFPTTEALISLGMRLEQSY